MASVRRSTSETEPKDPEIIELTPEAARCMFDDAAQMWLGISGEEFVRRWQAGEYADLVESEQNRRIVDLYLLMPFGR